MYAQDEVDVTGDLARTLITGQFPAFENSEIHFLDRGLDNAVFRAGDVVFRFPVRRVASTILDTEIAVMPSIAKALSVAVSVPRYAGAPTEAYPFTFAGFPFLEGVAASDLPLSDAQRSALAAPLATFLRALHALNVDQLGIAGQLPPDTIGRLDHRTRFPLVASRLEHLADDVDAASREALLAFLERASPRDREGERAVVHGDLYARHVLVDTNANLCGVIDWGDVHFGNPAVDLAIAFYVLPPSDIEEFYCLYGGVDKRTKELSLYRALYHGVLVADLALQWQRPAVYECGLRAIRTGLTYLKEPVQ